MNKTYIILLLCCGSLLAGSCKKYLNVQPEASYTESQVYGNEAALQQAFNGLYISLANNQSYGANLTTSIIEMLAQRYKPSITAANATDLGVFKNYNYASPTAMTWFTRPGNRPTRSSCRQTFFCRRSTMPSHRRS